MRALAKRISVVASEPPGLAEVRRICGLPIHGLLTSEEVEAVSRIALTSDAYASGFRLWEEQARAYVAFLSERGLFAPIRVGGGKSLVTWLCVTEWLDARKGKALVLVPSRVYIQVLTRDVPMARRVLLSFGDTPVHGLGGLDRERRNALAKRGTYGVYLMPYSLLSVEDTDEVLAAIDPDLVVADEAHNLRRVYGAARTRRFLAMMAARRRSFVALSGTVASRSILDYAHLMALALGERSPLPIEPGFVRLWSEALDAHMPAPKDEHRVAMRPLLDWAEAAGAGTLPPAPGGWRQAYRLRRDTVPGVVSSGEGRLGVSLVYANAPAEGRVFTDLDETALGRRFPPGQGDFVPSEAFAEMGPLERLQALLWATEAHWKTPSGDEIEYAIHGYKWRYELSAGFYNELVWPSIQAVAKRKGVTTTEAEKLLGVAQKHHKLWQKYARELRDFLLGDHVPGLDTPMLVGAEAARGGRGLPSALVGSWRRARLAEVPGMPERESRAVRVCDWKVRHAARWASEVPAREGAIVWVWNVEIGRWAAEIFSRELGGERILYCPAGLAQDRAVQDPSNAGRVVVASMVAHGEGKNLQHFRHQFFLQWPRDARRAEQVVGRLHRPGQMADELVVHICLTLDFDHQLFAATLADATHLHVTEGAQKLIYGSYQTPPRIYSSDFLVARGFEAHRLTAEQGAVLRDKGTIYGS